MPIQKRTAPKRIKQKPPLNLIILGDPGAGKATQTALLSKKYSFFDFDMGRELTIARERDPEIDAIQRRTADKGILTPTKVVKKIFTDRLAHLDSNDGIVFDGTPKMLGEAKLIARLLKQTKRPDPLVLYISIPEDEIINRISKRKGYFNAKFSKRSDDSIQGLKNRAKYYKKNIKEVTEYFKTKYPFVRISGLGSRSEVHAKIIKEIRKVQ